MCSITGHGDSAIISMLGLDSLLGGKLTKLLATLCMRCDWADQLKVSLYLPELTLLNT
jgi:hypothetical protein